MTTKWLKADFSQQEARIFAVAAGEQTMIQEFARGEDVYSNVGTELYGRLVNKTAAPQERFYAKTFFLAKIYGGGAAKLVQIDPQLTLPQARAGVLRFGKRYPRVEAYYAEQRQLLAERGYAVTLLGRKRWLPDIASGDRKLREAALRQGVNMPIQGTAADVLKLVLRIKLDQTQARVIIAVHDELGLRCQEGYLDAAKAIITTAAEEVGRRIGIDLPIEFGVGANWAEAG